VYWRHAEPNTRGLLEGVANDLVNAFIAPDQQFSRMYLNCLGLTTDDADVIFHDAYTQEWRQSQWQASSKSTRHLFRRHKVSL
jgi:hypothetical protein